MPALVAGIHVLLCCDKSDVDGRDKPGHDEVTKVAAKKMAPGGVIMSVRMSYGWSTR